MKSPWMHALAWLAAVAAAIALAWMAPDEASIERQLTLHFDMPMRVAPN